MKIVPGHYKNNENKPLAYRLYYPDDFKQGEKRPAFIMSYGIGQDIDTPLIVNTMRAVVDSVGIIGISFNMRGADSKAVVMRPRDVDADREAAFREFSALKDVDKTAMIDGAVSYSTLSAVKQAAQPGDVSFRSMFLYSPDMDPFEAYQSLLNSGALPLWRMRKRLTAPVNGTKCVFPIDVYDQLVNVDFIGTLASQVRTPTLIVHGENDQQAFCQTARKFYDNLRPEHQRGFHVIQGAAHSFEPHEFAQAIAISKQALSAALPELKQFRPGNVISGMGRLDAA